MYVVLTWDNLSVDQIVFHVKAPMIGVEKGLIHRSFLIIIFFIFSFNISYIILAKKRIIIFILCIILILSYICYKVKLYEYITFMTKKSDFIEQNYIDPKNVSITFHYKKNLIYIILESMENSYSDTVHGGTFQENLIPQLTKLAKNEINFSENMNILNGAYSLPFTQWTMGAIFAQHTGLPLRLPVDGNLIFYTASFFPNIVSLGDILEDHGYIQEFILGSDASYTSKGTFFKEHGNFRVLDYNYLIEYGIIPKGYKVFWGVEDKTIFDIARNELLKLSNQEFPFNVTILTVDTHPEDGYLSNICEEKIPGNQYKNVISCSDWQVGQFITWIQQQEFYKDTVIVIAGDHPTMKKNFINSDDNYIRKNYTCFINVEDKHNNARDFSSFDNFPTILSALGAEIPGNRLGLGANLFSSEQTIIEKYGYHYVQDELRKRNDFLSDYEKLAFDKSFIKQLITYNNNSIKVDKVDKNNILFFVDISKINNEEFTFAVKEIADIYCIISSDKDLSMKDIVKFDKISERIYTNNITISKYGKIIYIQFFIKTYSGKSYRFGLHRIENLF